ncbi:hypothetical protein BDQ17DRAFT_1421757 [Cyathus striatus]|nr:hypothetical protein BDQ17DRAFT_1421757 [Cyathus striatus]
MTTLIIGGTGSTGSKLAQLLHDANVPVLIASRSGTAPGSFQAVRFDWLDASTFQAPFEKDPSIDKVFLLGPVGGEMQNVKPFLDIGVTKGIKKWVLLGGAHGDKFGPLMSDIHAYWQDKGSDYTILRPTSFAENFAREGAQSIKAKNEIVTAAGDGPVPFVQTKDIAEAAFKALTTDLEEFKNTMPYICGPEFLTYDEVAAMLSKVLGRKITHRRVSSEELHATYLSMGFPQVFADILTDVEALVLKGWNKDVLSKDGGPGYKYVGRHTLREYFEENKGIWAAV